MSPQPGRDSAAPSARPARSEADIARAQKLRLQRTGLGVATHLGGTLIMLSYFVTGMLELKYLLHYLAGITLACSTFMVLILTNFNLRFKDPSMTAAQIIMTVWPTAYVMYFVSVPEARTLFLLMGTVGVLFGVFALDFRRMLIVCAGVLTSYLAVVASLVRWAPERVDLRIEGVSAFAFAVVLVLITYICSYMARLRRTVRDRNVRLQETNTRLEQAMDELRELATRDHLTRLPNRRSAIERLTQETARVSRGQGEITTVCVGLLDIDHFKRVNDSYGHHVGDQVLCGVSQVLQETLRQDEFVGRYGGEEFLLILVVPSRQAADSAARRIRQALTTVRAEGLPRDHRITASLGLTFHAIGETLGATLERTDRALYQAKQQGRDCHVFDDFLVLEPELISHS
ncbi:hypothetical protein GCM10008955_40110 [Deinococcus malanensis]|uniref:GGDEF domain-containing protein n=1 Tax=Deinococcus malanensis TaxID=1706855 RepID=A0ABQ2F250_9DEIO|nr:diguanylate cyclase [Deinococcus malanensis]GGK42330.1 hypothetical protein GCM10008955_40110 [Deinococcus malanensis]